MSKMSNLDLVLDEMITAGQKMIDAATALKEMFSDTAPAVSKTETKQKRKKPRLLLQKLRNTPSRKYAESWLHLLVKERKLKQRPS